MTRTLRTRIPCFPPRDMSPGHLRWHLLELTQFRLLLRRRCHQSTTTLLSVLKRVGATRPVTPMVIGTLMVIPNPPSLRSPRVRVLTPTLSRHLNTIPLAHPPYLITPHVASGHSIHLTPPNSLLVTLPPLENLPETLLIILRHPVNSLTLLSPNLFLGSPLSSASRAVLPHQRASCSVTARSQGADAKPPTTTLLLLPSLMSPIPSSLPPRSPFSTILCRVSPELTNAQGALSPPRSRLSRLASSSRVFLRRVHHTKLLLRDRLLTVGRPL